MALVKKYHNPSLLGSVLFFAFFTIVLLEGMFILLAGVAMERGQLENLALEIQKITEKDFASEDPCPIIAPELDLAGGSSDENENVSQDDLFNQLKLLGIINVGITILSEDNQERCRANFLVSEDFETSSLNLTTRTLEINLQEEGVLSKLFLGLQTLIYRFTDPEFRLQATFVKQMEDRKLYEFEYTIKNESLRTLINSIEIIIVPSLFILVLNLILIMVITIIYISYPLHEVSLRIRQIRKSVSRGSGEHATKDSSNPETKEEVGIFQLMHFPLSKWARRAFVREFKEISIIKKNLSQLENRLNPVDVISIKEKSTLHDTRNIYSNISKLIRILVDYTGNLDPKQYKKIKKQSYVVPNKGNISENPETNQIQFLMDLVREQHEEIQFKLRQLIRYATSETQFSDLKEFELKGLLEEVRKRGIVKAMAIDIDSIPSPGEDSKQLIEIQWAESDEKQIVFAIEKDLQDIVYNFIENSVKAINQRIIAEREFFGKEGKIGKIKISVEEIEVIKVLNGNQQRKRMSVITIEDNGIGMEEYEKENLFKFALGKNYSIEVDDFDADSGIGLYFCRQQISRLGGNIELVKTRYFNPESTEPTGTIFKILLPVKRSSPHSGNNDGSH